MRKDRELEKSRFGGGHGRSCRAFSRIQATADLRFVPGVVFAHGLNGVLGGGVATLTRDLQTHCWRNVSERGAIFTSGALTIVIDRPTGDDIHRIHDVDSWDARVAGALVRPSNHSP